ncbi:MULTISPECIES: hypothetical protein [Desulfococcus]|uniref:Uncharacterized protein n=1 Tax=Desulfococcus multivorans DSM 2059 TaxID=1121405 RepID=S7TBZ9_DESML|nr:hypothetical protein [Desulfococcus multivorans]AOY60648.1 uncharacterized protein Dmul_38800 [Desulfococcus multivorans]AQV02735.1 hypothetical protein B2D07_19455 [Desulfococcus multivorans]EPR34692.1 hypothetical protein dsmv_3264 [Desulfococcus multivorans DSM 2059]SKA03028.1 hypothetical protein SAMN02745446_02474 [Desulfococcus multivorans DSM 2059]
MKPEDDDHGGSAERKRSTLIVPGGNLDSVAPLVEGRDASSGTETTPPFDHNSFEAKRIMAPGGDLDAIDLKAGTMVRGRHTGKSKHSVAPPEPRPAGEEKEMMFRERGTFIDSEPDERYGQGRQSISRTVQVRTDRPRQKETAGLRFQDGDEDSPVFSNTFHDGEEESHGRPLPEPEMHSGPEPIKTSGLRDAAAPFQALREVDYRTSDNSPPLRSPVVKMTPFSRNDDVGKTTEEDVAYLDVSTAQLEAVIQHIMERVFVEKIEAILEKVIEKAVAHEMQQIRKVFMEELGRPVGFRDDETR